MIHSHSHFCFTLFLNPGEGNTQQAKCTIIAREKQSVRASGPFSSPRIWYFEIDDGIHRSKVGNVSKEVVCKTQHCALSSDILAASLMLKVAVPYIWQNRHNNADHYSKR